MQEHHYSPQILERCEEEDATFKALVGEASVEMDWHPKPLTREDLQKTFEMIDSWRSHGM